jgi:hypothetical protein
MKSPDGLLDIESNDISYSGAFGSRTSWSVIERFLRLSKAHEEEVAAGRVVFLPRSTKYRIDSARDYSITRYDAPLRQPAGDLRFMPLNVVRALQGRDFAKDLTAIYGRLSLPYFRRALPSEILRIAESETDAFLKFNRFLNKRLGAIGAATTARQIRETLEEIDYEVANLRLEAAKLAKLRALKSAHRAELTLNLTALGATTGTAGQELVAAIGSPQLGSALADLEANIDVAELKANDLYFVFLLQESQ